MTREEIIMRANKATTDAFEAGAEWEHKRLVEKACEWLKDWDRKTMYELSMIMGSEFIEDFRKAMDE